jgi:putative endonuclease
MALAKSVFGGSRFLEMKTWTVYIVRCADDTLYTGIARDTARRVAQHNSNDLLAARYTRGRRPVVLVYQDVVATRSAALKREYRIKRMSREEKEKLIKPVLRAVYASRRY